MSQQDLKNALQTLRHELDATESIDAESRQLMAELDSQLHTRLLLQDKEVGNLDGLIEQVEQARRQFSVEHPRIQGVLDSIVSMLSRMGI